MRDWRGTLGEQFGSGRLLHLKGTSFSVERWRDLSHPDIGLGCVPVLWEGNMDTLDVLSEMNSLARSGSRAAEGFNNPEGIVIFHTQGNFMLKKTFEKDDAGKTHGV